MRELWQRILQTGGVKVYGVFLGFVSISITTRYLGPEDRGHLVLVYRSVHCTTGDLSTQYRSGAQGKSLWGVFETPTLVPVRDSRGDRVCTGPRT